MQELANFFKTRYLPAHQLNNEGCRCPTCQKVHLNHSKLIVVEPFHDRESQNYKSQHTHQAYIGIILQLSEWDKMSRKIRFLLPEICVYSKSAPEYWISKTRESGGVRITRSKSKMNMFQIQNFFLEGYLAHNPIIVDKKRQKTGFGDSAANECIVLAKYRNNTCTMLTLKQIEGLFKSKHKNLREGLMYLQTLVGGTQFTEMRVNINLDRASLEHPTLYERAKLETRIILNEVKVVDAEYFPQKEEVGYERRLKEKSLKEYLVYISLKIVFLSSKTSPSIMREATFKFVVVEGSEYLWDLHVNSYANSEPLWQNPMGHAFEAKLKKTMSLIDVEPASHRHLKHGLSQHIGNKQELSSNPIPQPGVKARNISKWLEKSTSAEWEEMKVIRRRLEKLEVEKKSLMESQEKSQQVRMPNRSLLRSNPRRVDSFMNPE